MTSEAKFIHAKAALTSGKIEVRAATIEETHTIAELIDLAGEGLPRRIWKSYAPKGADPMIFGAARAADGSGNFSWRTHDSCRISMEPPA